jgi:hypothetical protein
MTTSDIEAAADRVMADPDFARRLHETPEAPEVRAEYNLDPAEWQALHRALAADVDAATDEVVGFGGDPFSFGLSFDHVGPLGSGDPTAEAGKRQHKPITIVKEWGASTP